MNLYRALAFIGTGGLIFSVSARVSFGTCPPSLRIVLNSTLESTVETEIDEVPDAMLVLLTTVDGRVSGLLGAHEAPPTFVKFVRETYGAGVSPREVSWDHLPPQQQRDLLAHASALKETPWEDDRRVPGIRIRTSLVMHFPEPTKFLGVEYPAGSHEIDPSKFMRQVEYADKSQNPKNLEFHFRAAGPAGDVKEDASRWYRWISGGEFHHHEHLVGEVPFEELRKAMAVTTAAASDHYRRTNLVGEMMWVVEEGRPVYPIRSKLNPEITNFDNLSAANLERVGDYYQARARGENPELGTDLKLAFVGFRGSDFYDGPVQLIGYEPRILPPDGDPEVYREYLNTMQWGIVTRNWGVSPESMRKWIKKATDTGYRTRKSIGRAVADQWYDRGVQGVESALKNFVEKSGPVADLDPERIKSLLAQNEEVQMIFHDWSLDPVLFEDAAYLQKLREHQVASLKQLVAYANGPLPSGGANRIVRDFLVESGLYARMAESLGRPKPSP